MRVLVWLQEPGWERCVDAVAPDAEVTLLVALPEAPLPAPGLLGRHRARHEAGAEMMRAASEEAARDLLAAARERLGRDAGAEARTGRVEREVAREAAGHDLLVLARDGDPERLGPHSLGPAARFVVDHAPCAVLLLWPGDPPRRGLPPEPPRRPPPP
jgi:nucleotide-binding universal stress UspA family protein